MTTTRFRTVALGLLVALAVSAAAQAHHSLAAEFDVTRTVTITGAIVDMKWTNPHSWLTVEAKNARGQAERWQVEFSSPNNLYRRGWRRSDLPPKATVTIAGYPSRDKTARVITALDVKLPDGRTLFAGMAEGGR